MTPPDPLITALAALPSPTLEGDRDDAIRLALREGLHPAPEPAGRRLARTLTPALLAADAATCPGWTVHRVTVGPGRGGTQGSERF